MAEIPDGLRVPTTDRPTIFNRTFGLWGIIGGIAVPLGLLLMPASILPASLAIGMSVPSLLVGSAASLAVGAVGGMIGKRRMERELIEGKPIETPTFFNAHSLSGMLVTDLALTAVAVAASAVGVPLGAPAMVGLSFASIVVGGIGGAIYGKREMQKTVDQAQTILNTPLRQPALGFAQERAPGRAAQPEVAVPGTYRDSVPPAESSLLAAKQREGISKESFAATLAARAAETPHMSAAL